MISVDFACSCYVLFWGLLLIVYFFIASIVYVGLIAFSCCLIALDWFELLLIACFVFDCLSIVFDYMRLLSIAFACV